MIVLAALAFVGCSTTPVLTEGGARVTRSSQADLPGGCRVLGDVPIGVAPDASRPRTEDELVMLMRNKAAESGATHVIVDSSEQRNEGGEEPYYVGRGRAYKCDAAANGGPPEETSGGEEGEDGEDGEAGADGEAGGEGGGLSDEDLL